MCIRDRLKDLAAQGHTVFVSSHLMSEMAKTATRLVVIGRGRLIADTTVAGFVALAGGHTVRVRTPEIAQLRELLAGPDITVTADGGDCLIVDGLSTHQIGTAASKASITLFELANQNTSLETAFMELTQGSVEYQATPDVAVAS